MLIFYFGNICHLGSQLHILLLRSLRFKGVVIIQSGLLNLQVANVCPDRLIPPTILGGIGLVFTLDSPGVSTGEAVRVVSAGCAVGSLIGRW